MARESDSRRLFFALWPPDDVRARIHDATRGVVADSGGRPISVRNLHITVQFLGQVPAARLEAVKQAGAGVSAAEFDVVLERIESWPRSKVLCLIPSHAPAALDHLAEQLRFNLLARDFKLQEQEFRPHVTLARDLPRRRPAQLIDAIHWHVGELALVDSQLTARGSQYSVLDRWPLR